MYHDERNQGIGLELSLGLDIVQIVGYRRTLGHVRFKYAYLLSAAAAAILPTLVYFSVYS